MGVAVTVLIPAAGAAAKSAPASRQQAALKNTVVLASSSCCCAHLSVSVPVSWRVISPEGWNMLVMKEEEMPTRD
jgi:hypothetical protein